MKAWLPLLLCTAVQAGIGVRLSGNRFFNDRKIEATLAPNPEDYSQDGLDGWREDAEYFLLDLYHASGFFDARVKAEMKRKSQKPDDWEAIIAIEEGERYRFDSVLVLEAADSAWGAGGGSAGADTSGPAPEDSLAYFPRTSVAIDTSKLSARPGEPYREELVFEDRRFLQRRYGNTGFVRAQVSDKVEVKPPTRTVSVRYLVQPSYPVVFDTLIVRNLRAPPLDSLAGLTREKQLRSLIPYRRGDTVRISSNDRAIEKLQYTGIFNYARIKDSLLPGPEHRSALLLLTEEHVPGNFRTSVFFETQYGAGVSVDARHSNIAGTLNEIRGGASVAVDRQTFYAGYGSPITLGYLVRFDDDLDFNWYQDRAVHRDQALFEGDFRALNSARLTWPWSYWLRLVGNVELEARSRKLDTATSRERSLNLNLIPTSFLTFVNQQMDPTRGVRLAFSWGNGGPLIEDGKFRLAEFRHNWLEARTTYYYYYPPLRQFKLALRLDGGYFFGPGGTNSDRFYLGGSHSVRSYNYQTLCPDTTTGSEGTVCSTQGITAAYIQTSQELRAALFDFGFPGQRSKLSWIIPLQIAFFYDFGKVWDTEEGFSPSTQRLGQGYAYGTGLRYPLLGMFNMRVDFVWGSGPRRLWVDLAQSF